MQKTLLVFPVDMPQSVALARTALRLGFSVVAATSEPIAPSHFPEFQVVQLPYVTQPGFDDALAQFVRRHDIELVFTPHPTIWWHLSTLSRRPDFPAKFRVCNESPFEMEWQPYGEAYRWAEDCAGSALLASGDGAPSLPMGRLASLYRNYNLIPGQSDEAKLHALTQIARQTPPGDVVEIGSLYGRSAFALAWLAKFHGIGSVVCIDPWDMSAISNQGEQASMVNAAVKGRDWQRTFLGFVATLSMFDNVNYLRATSERGAEDYRQATVAGCVCSAEFGKTSVTGRIAILHIDGNHKYETVRQDVETWLPFVQAGGWLLLDDYVWAFGDGPRRVGDELLARLPVQAAFTAADTLFVRL